MVKEWKAIFKKPLFLAIILGVALIPTLYNVIFLSSMWDPYGKLSDLPVAVVNQDKQATYNGQKMTIGKDMVSNLKKSDALDFHFVDEKKAQAGLKAGDYYMVVTLPSNLSEKAASILTQDPQQMTIDYQTSSGHSFIAAKMSDSAMNQIKQTVANNVTRSYTTALFEKMGTLKTGMAQAARGSEKLVDGSQQLETGSQTLTTNLDRLAQSTLTFSDGTTSFKQGLNTYTAGVGQLGSGLETFKTGLGTYTTGVNQLGSGLATLEGGLNTYTTGVNQLGAGVQQLADQTPTLVAGVNQLTSGMSNLHTGIENYTAGVGRLGTGLVGLNSGLVTYTDQVGLLALGASQISSQSQRLRFGMSQLEAGVQALSDQLGQSLESLDQVSQLTAGLDQLNTAFQNVSFVSQKDRNDQVETALVGLTTAAQSILENSQADSTQALSSVQETAAYQSLTPDQQAEITAALSTNSRSNTSGAAQEILSTIQGLKASLSGLEGDSGFSQLQATANQVLPAASQTLSNLSAGIHTTQTAVSDQLLPATKNLSQGLATYTEGVDTVSNGANQLKENSSALISGADQLTLGASQLTDKTEDLLSGASRLTSGTSQLASKTPALTEGVDRLALGAAQLTSKTPVLTEGLTQLVSGSSQLTSKTPVLTEGLTQLVSGAGQLTAKTPELLTATEKLAMASGQIATGSDQLASGGHTLTDGIGQLRTGATSLNEGLETAHNQLDTTKTNPSNAQVLATPLTLSKTDEDHVPVNGVGMAPYMISVALFVAALSTNMIFAKLPSGRHLKTRKEWFKARIGVNGIVAVLAAIILYGGVHLIGLTANHEFETFLMILLSSMCSMAVVTALNTWNNRIGAFLSLILLLLQLASSAGTYPLPLTDRFFQAINPWLPMSYSVSGLRQTISMTGAIGGQVSFLLMTLVIFMVLGFFAYRPQALKEDSL